MDELQALERWSELYSVGIYVYRGEWVCSIAERQEGTATLSRNWADMRVEGKAKHDPILAMQSALIQARAKWPEVRV